MNAVAATENRRRRLDQLFVQCGLYHELHHLLLRPMAVTPRGVLDAGTMCRDSAVILAMIVDALGFETSLCEGQASLCAPLANGVFCELYFETHAWLDIGGYGLCDFSPDLATGGGPGWADLPGSFLCGSRYQPRPGAFVYLVNDAGRYGALREETCATKPAFRSIYLEERRRPFGEVRDHAMDYVQSPLLENLREEPFFSPDIFIKAALHLWQLGWDESVSFRDRPQRDAWAAIAAIPVEDAQAFQRLRSSWRGRSPRLMAGEPPGAGPAPRPQAPPAVRQ